MIVAIDGPAGSGKSSVGELLAKKFNIPFLSTGKIYRGLAYKVLQTNADYTDEKSIYNICRNIQWKFEENLDNILEVFMDGEKLGTNILSEEIANIASKVSASKLSRNYLTKIQKDLVAKGDIILEGRDIASVIAPNADVKIYLDASPKSRADRRHKQMLDKNIISDYSNILKTIEQRDERDGKRDIAPLTKDKNAIYIDSSNLQLSEVVDNIITLIEEKREIK